MIDVLLNILGNGIAHELNDNVFAANLYSIIKQSNKIPTIKILQGSMFSTHKLYEELEDYNVEARDYRLEYIIFSGIRTFPGDKKYKISFTNDSKRPCSAIFLGNNGVGKTTIFNCLEKIALGQIFSVPYRELPNYDESIYMRNINASMDSTYIRVNTLDNKKIEFNNLGINQPIIPPAFFCSNTDVSTLLKYGVTPAFVAEQLGLSQYQRLINSLKELRKQIEENYDEYLGLINDFIYIEGLIIVLKELKNTDDIVSMIKRIFPCNTWKSQKNGISSSEITSWEKKVMKNINFFSDLKEETGKILWGIHNNPIDSSKRQHELNLINDAISKLKSHFSIYCKVDCDLDSIDVSRISIEEIERVQQNRKIEIEEKERKYPMLKAEKKMIDNLLQTEVFLSSKYYEIIMNFKNNSSDIFEELLKDFYEMDIDKIPISVTSNGVLQIDIIPKDPKSENSLEAKNCPPQQYLNTFRFKLFSVALKVSLSLYAQRLYNVNFPIVIDDVFDSSDFINKEKINGFICHIFNGYNNLSLHYNINNKTNTKENQLQLIFFTQDAVIAKSVYDAIKYEMCYPAKISRIYKYLEASDKDEEIDAEYKYIVLEDLIDNTQ